MRRRMAYAAEMFDQEARNQVVEQEKVRLQELARLQEFTKQQKGITFDYWHGERQPNGEEVWFVETKPPYQIIDAVALPGEAGSPASASAVPSQAHDAPAVPKRRGRPPKVH